MDLYLLKVKHKFDREYEDIGIFSSIENVRKAMHEYLEVKQPSSEDEYNFRHRHMTLDELY